MEGASAQRGPPAAHLPRRPVGDRPRRRRHRHVRGRRRALAGDRRPVPQPWARSVGRAGARPCPPVVRQVRRRPSPGSGLVDRVGRPRCTLRVGGGPNRGGRCGCGRRQSPGSGVGVAGGPPRPGRVRRSRAGRVSTGPARREDPADTRPLPRGDVPSGGGRASCRLRRHVGDAARPARPALPRAAARLARARGGGSRPRGARARQRGPPAERPRRPRRRGQGVLPPPAGRGRRGHRRGRSPQRPGPGRPRPARPGLPDRRARPGGRARWSRPARGQRRRAGAHQRLPGDHLRHQAPRPRQPAPGRPSASCRLDGHLVLLHPRPAGPRGMATQRAGGQLRRAGSRRRRRCPPRACRAPHGRPPAGRPGHGTASRRRSRAQPGGRSGSTPGHRRARRTPRP